MDRTFQRENSVVYNSSFSILDGIPFKIGPNFTQKHKIHSSSDLKNLTRRHRQEEEYDFSVEEGVLKWADERQKQIAAQQRAEEERLARAQEEANESLDSDISDHEYENDGWQNATVTASPPSVTQASPAPVLPAISNDILTPVHVSNQNGSSNKPNSDSQKSVDFSLFETEDDPFDRFERLTLNDLTELKNVFDNSRGKGESGGSNTSEEAVYENTKILNNPPNGIVTSSSTVNSTSDVVDGGDYVKLDPTRNSEPTNGNVNGKIRRKQKTYKGKVIPPVPPRPSLVAKNPLPAIGLGVTNVSPKPTGTGKSTNPFEADPVADVTRGEPVHKNESSSNTYENVSAHTDYQSVSFSKTPTFGITNNVDSSVSSNSPFLCANQELRDTASKKSQDYMNVAPVKPMGVPMPGMTQPISIASDIVGVSMKQSEDLPLPLTISPPPRPSSKQSWNRYSPLPQPGFGTGSLSSLSSASSITDVKTVIDVDPYDKLPPESKRVVDSVVGMGFPKPRTARAVETLGADEKEVIDYLCVVGKLIDKGHEAYRVEEALNLFKNNQEKSERFLALFKQFQELGFSDLRIKAELVKNDLDSDKTLDSLTA
ncbi:ubiquitin-associated protein 1-like isoform X2 [Ostrea edulis]|uniref:ubiquitin-associated protein 1-like isoform X2 n=1 Tax=Ostrea edulis TaxID=37623 RepID=UPI0024AEAD93|nr:ubiquitin-associated protein 1-like isoform X2 [Ostrea edulis]